MAIDAFDVLVMGAGIAGSIAALSLAQRGLRVAVADKKADVGDYKLLCTHCVQPIALPVLRKLGLEEGLLTLGAVPTKTAIRTRVGSIDSPGAFYDDACTLTALNIERRLLDPFLVSHLRTTPGIDVHLDSALAGLNRRGDDDWDVILDGGGGRRSLRCRLLVAADGRGSELARTLDNRETLRSENDRACMFAYFEGVPPRPDARTLYLMGVHDEALFYYPLGSDRALLAAFLPKTLMPTCRTTDEKVHALLEMFIDYPECPDLSQAHAVSPVHGYLNYPNLLRHGAVQGVPFIGDAAISLDGMSGSGCAFAVVSADLMAESVGDVLATGGNPAPAVQRYARLFDDYFAPRAQGIAADARVGRSQSALDAVHRRICAHPSLQRAFIALIGRLTTPTEFQRTFLTFGTRRLEAEAPS